MEIWALKDNIKPLLKILTIKILTAIYWMPNLHHDKKIIHPFLLHRSGFLCGPRCSTAVHQLWEQKLENNFAAHKTI